MEAIEPINSRERGIYIIVCTDMIWQVVRSLLKDMNSLNEQKYIHMRDKANYIFKLHTVIRHPNKERLEEDGWILNHKWADEQKSIVRNIAQIIYHLILSIRMGIRAIRYENTHKSYG